MSVHCIIVMNLSIQTSSRCRRAASLSNSLRGILVKSMSSTVFLSRYGAIYLLSQYYVSARSCSILVAV